MCDDELFFHSNDASDYDQLEQGQKITIKDYEQARDDFKRLVEIKNVSFNPGGARNGPKLPHVIFGSNGNQKDPFETKLS